MEKTRAVTEIQEAMAFWKDSIQGFLAMVNDPKATRKQIDSAFAYYLRASKRLRAA